MIPGSCIPDDDHNLISSTNINREIGQYQFINILTVRSAMLISFDTNKSVHQKSVTYTSMYL
jgi:DNA-binding CsgD family transcriptional regulator